MGGSLCNRAQADRNETSEKKQVNNYHRHALISDICKAAIGLCYDLDYNTLYIKFNHGIFMI